MVKQYVHKSATGYTAVRYHLMPNNLCRHHWSKALSLLPFPLVIAQHSETYGKIGTHMLYNFNFTAVEIRDLQKCRDCRPTYAAYVDLHATFDKIWQDVKGFG